MSLNENTKPKYHCWNEDAFRSSVYVQSMTPIQRWMYRTLLQACFFESTRPYVPNDDKILWRLAGCENATQWEANKEEIKSMFTIEIVDGQEMLVNKRVKEDWEELVKSRFAASEKGRNGGLTRGKQQLTTGNQQLTKEVKEVKGSGVSEVEEGSEEAENSEPQPPTPSEPNPLTKAVNVARQVKKLSGDKLTPDEKLALNALGARQGSQEVVGDYQVWVGENPGRRVRDYLRVMKRRFGEDGVLVTDPEVADVAAELYSIGDQPFAGRIRDGLDALLRRYSRDEVVSAYQQFFDSRDEFTQKFAPKDFVEGAGDDVVLGRRKDAERLRLSEEAVARAREEMTREPEQRSKADEYEEEGVQFEL